jgi:primosomal protein N''
LAPGPISPSYAVLRELAKHPDREQLVQANPNITKREAREIMRKLKHTGVEKAKAAQEVTSRRSRQARCADGNRSSCSASAPNGHRSLTNVVNICLP